MGQESTLEDIIVSFIMEVIIKKRRRRKGPGYSLAVEVLAVKVR